MVLLIEVRNRLDYPALILFSHGRYDCEFHMFGFEKHGLAIHIMIIRIYITLEWVAGDLMDHQTFSIHVLNLYDFS